MNFHIHPPPPPALKWYYKRTTHKRNTKYFQMLYTKKHKKSVHAKDYVKSYSVHLGNFRDSNAAINIEERRAKNNVSYFLKLESLQPNN
ncbi:hypothetical protein [Helicobacter bilis]|uniref:hypothetical protein n=1 Tax=Helicobacter bilis TaxID=37372 RepID=UPI0026EFF03F|nr:hypothetical protein [Helicobacter bilis]